MDSIDELAIKLGDRNRRIWNWYFRHWYGESDNKLGITRIDAELVS